MITLHLGVHTLNLLRSNFIEFLELVVCSDCFQDGFALRKLQIENNITEGVGLITSGIEHFVSYVWSDEARKMLRGLLARY